jgi:hypothetical protein
MPRNNYAYLYRPGFSPAPSSHLFFRSSIPAKNLEPKTTRQLINMLKRTHDSEPNLSF